MNKAIEVQAHGLKCDNPNCDYRKDDIAMQDYGAWVGALCPDCGEPLLTETQYEQMQAVLELVNTMNELADDPVVAAVLKQADEELGVERRRGKLSIKADANGDLRVGDVEWIDN